MVHPISRHSDISGRHPRRLRRLTLQLAALSLLASCGSSPGDTAAEPDPFPAHAPTGVRTPQSSVTGAVTLQDGALAYAAASWSNKQVSSDWTLTFPATDTVSQLTLKPGTVLAVPRLDGGDLRVVTGNTTSGGTVTVTTGPATVKDYVKDADLKVSVGGDAAKSDLVDPWVDIDLSGKTLSDKSGDSWEMKLEIDKGRIAGNPRFDMDVVISWGDLHLFQLTSAGFFVVQADLKLSGKSEKSIDKSLEIPLVERQIVALVGGVPVWVTPYVKLEVKGEAKLSAEGEVTAGFRASLPGSFNLKWALEESPHWSKSTTGKVTLKPRPVKVAKAEVAGEAELTVTAYVGVKLYQRVSVELEAAASAKAEVKVASGCSYTLSAAAEGKITAKLDGFGPVEDKEESKSLFDLSKTLTSGSCSAPVVDAGATDGAGGSTDAGPSSGCGPVTKPCDKGPMDCCAKAVQAAQSEPSQACRDERDDAKQAAQALPSEEKAAALSAAEKLYQACQKGISSAISRAKAVCLKDANCEEGSFFGAAAKHTEASLELSAVCSDEAAKCYTAQATDPDGDTWKGVICGSVYGACVSYGGPLPGYGG